MNFRGVFLALLLPVPLHAAGDPPHFYATMTIGAEHGFVLRSPGGKASEYLRLGESFAGWALKSYDPKTGVLEVEHGGRLARLSLVPDGPVKSAGPSDRQLLGALAAKIQPTGFSVKTGGDIILVFGGRQQLGVGEKFSVRYQDTNYELTLVAASPAGFTLRWRGQEFNRPLRPPDRAR